MFNNRSKIYPLKNTHFAIYFKIKDKLIIKTTKKIFHEVTDDTIETLTTKKFTLDKNIYNSFHCKHCIKFYSVFIPFLNFLTFLRH